MEYERLLSKYEYAELRIEQSHDSVVRIKNEEVKHASGLTKGISARVLEQGSWGFASSTRESAEELLRRAHKLASLGKGTIRLALPKQEKKALREKAEAVNADDQVRTLLEASREMKADKVSSRDIACTNSDSKTEFINSAGTEIIQEAGYTFLACSCTARAGETIQRASERAWSRSGFSDIDTIGTARKSSEKVLRLLGALPPPKGRFTVVLDPEMTGMLCHEAIGHACEADSVVDKESVLAGRVGEQIGSELVNIADDPTAKDFGHYWYDDEGVKGKRTVLVENGMLKEFVNSMETAHKLGAEPNGHARAEGYDAVPVVRMSNTYFQRGESSVDEVFGIKSGVYLKGMKGGSVDIFSGGFMFKAEEAYPIEKGEKGKIMRDVTITGNILKTLHGVECVGNDFGTTPGVCGKLYQEIPVSDGGPHVRIRNVAIG